MHVVLTRPGEDCLDLIKKLKIIGHTITHVPIIKIFPLKIDRINFSRFKALVFTSSNAIRNFQFYEEVRSIKCYCVGNQTAQTAKKYGFYNIISADGTVNALKQLILNDLEPKLNPILYLRGEFVSGNLDKDLMREGFSVESIINYTTSPINEITDENLKFLKKNKPDAIFVYSSKSAESLLNLINKYSLLNVVTQSNLMCISEKVLLLLKQIKWKKQFIFNPGEEEFLLSKIK